MSPKNSCAMSLLIRSHIRQQQHEAALTGLAVAIILDILVAIEIGCWFQHQGDTSGLSFFGIRSPVAQKLALGIGDALTYGISTLNCSPSLVRFTS